MSVVTWMPNWEAVEHASVQHDPDRPWEDLVTYDYEAVEVFVGMDIGKSAHHAVAIDRTGKKLLDKALSQDKVKLRARIRCAEWRELVTAFAFSLLDRSGQFEVV